MTGTLCGHRDLFTRRNRVNAAPLLSLFSRCLPSQSTPAFVRRLPGANRRSSAFGRRAVSGITADLRFRIRIRSNAARVHCQRPAPFSGRRSLCAVICGRVQRNGCSTFVDPISIPLCVQSPLFRPTADLTSDCTNEVGFGNCPSAAVRAVWTATAGEFNSQTRVRSP
jgi:hypothetical protein